MMPSICNGSAPAAPSSSSSGPVVPPGDADAPCTRLMVTYLEKRARNLDKRKAKLDGYLQNENAGTTLNRDQKEALKQLPVVVGMIECLKETSDHVIKIISEEERKLEKQHRKLTKRMQADCHRQTVNLFAQFMKLQHLLQLCRSEAFKENVKNGSSGTLNLTEDELNKLTVLLQMVLPPEIEKSDLSKLLADNAENMVNFLKGNEGSYCGSDFKVFRDILKRVEELEFLTSSASEKDEKFEETNVCEVVTEKADVVEEAVEKTGQTGNAGVDSFNCDPLPLAIEVPARTVKEPLEILSAVCGSYNFLQDSEIEEPQNAEKTLPEPGFNAFESFIQMSPDFSVAPTHSVHPDPHQLMVQQPVRYAITLPYPQNLVGESVYMPHGLPAGYGNGLAMTTPYTFSQPIVSHDGTESHGMMVPTTVYYSMTGPVVSVQREFDGHAPFEAVDVSQPGSAQICEIEETTETPQAEEEKAATNEPEKQKFSMNPNADVFRSKSHHTAEGEFVASENTRGGFGGRRNWRGGRGFGSYQGYQGRWNHRGQGYNGRGGRGTHPRGRGGCGGYDQNEQNSGTDGTQE